MLTVTSRIIPEPESAGWRRFPPDNLHRQGDHRPNIRDVGGEHEGIAGLGELAKLANVLLRHAELDGLESAWQLNRLGDATDAFRGCRGHRHDRRGLAFSFVDLLLLSRLG